MVSIRNRNYWYSNYFLWFVLWIIIDIDFFSTKYSALLGLPLTLKHNFFMITVHICTPFHLLCFSFLCAWLRSTARFVGGAFLKAYAISFCALRQIAQIIILIFLASWLILIVTARLSSVLVVWDYNYVCIQEQIVLSPHAMSEITYSIFLLCWSSQHHTGSHQNESGWPLMVCSGFCGAWSIILVVCDC